MLKGWAVLGTRIMLKIMQKGTKMLVLFLKIKVCTCLQSCFWHFPWNFVFPRSSHSTVLKPYFDYKIRWYYAFILLASLQNFNSFKIEFIIYCFGAIFYSVIYEANTHFFFQFSDFEHHRQSLLYVGLLIWITEILFYVYTGKCVCAI